MLSELHIANLGVIEELSLVLPSGSVAITGETGAGKTMIVGAIQLLTGGRADPEMVRIGADEAVVEARLIEADGTEVVARRVIPAAGRSRAYLDGALATAGGLAERIAPLIDLHGQHAQQSLLKPITQRRALDRFGSIDVAPVRELRAELAAIDAALEDLGGDETARAREIDLLRYQLDELDTAALHDPAEDDALGIEEDELANAHLHQAAASDALSLLGSEGTAAEALGSAIGGLQGRDPFAAVVGRLEALQEELADCAKTVRDTGSAIVDDPERRDTLRQRRQLLVELRRKYGPTLDAVMDYHVEIAERIRLLESHEHRVAELTDRRAAAADRLRAESEVLATARRSAAVPLAGAVETELTRLAMPQATLEVEVAGDAGDEVEIRLAPNPGLPALPIGKNASGGELSRVMLALRLVLSGGPPIKVFDEVDAGIGGETARAVGEALADLGGSAQVFVVTHLPQVAALADHHVVIDKVADADSTTSQARVLGDDERIVEVSRMLSGSPSSSSAREHAEELLGSNPTR